MSETSYPLSYRISRAVMAVLFNLAVWVLVPTLILGELESGLPSTPLVLSSDFIYAFGIAITALQGIGALTMGMALSVPFVSGSYVAEAYYLWTATQGGAFSFSVYGWNIELTFPTLLFLLVLPTLFNALKAPIAYLLDQSEASLPSPDTA